MITSAFKPDLISDTEAEARSRTYINSTFIYCIDTKVVLRYYNAVFYTIDAAYALVPMMCTIDAHINLYLSNNYT